MAKDNKKEQPKETGLAENELEEVTGGTKVYDGSEIHNDGGAIYSSGGAVYNSGGAIYNSGGFIFGTSPDTAELNAENPEAHRRS